jgi:predicted enzyme related to lactoylglutathione lyase
MFAVPDVAEAVAELKARGVPFHGEIEDTPVCHMAFGTDPEGNGFILHKRK